LPLPFITQETKKLSDRQAVASLLAAELSSLIFIIRKRGYLEQLERMISEERVGYYFNFDSSISIYQREMEE
jgi:hypothetical protein